MHLENFSRIDENLLTVHLPLTGSHSSGSIKTLTCSLIVLRVDDFTGIPIEEKTDQAYFFFPETYRSMGSPTGIASYHRGPIAVRDITTLEPSRREEKAFGGERSVTGVDERGKPLDDQSV